MDYGLIKEKLASKLAAGNIEENVSMARKTTFHCGGSAKLLVTANSLDELRFTLSVMKDFGAEWMILGNGSNVLFGDGGYDGVVIKLGKEFYDIVIEENRITAGAAVLLSYLSKLAGAAGLSGLEFACGIPGTLGGGIFMNAGAYGGFMKDCISTVTAVTADGEIYKYDVSELGFAYRHSRFMECGEIIISAELELCFGDADAIQAAMAENNAKRKEKQPVAYPSAGSFFKRPEGYFAGALIEQAGLKGFSVGGAEVSSLHAGFIINKGNASASDVIALCRYVQDTVYKKSGVRLEPEVRIIGE